MFRLSRGYHSCSINWNTIHLLTFSARQQHMLYNALYAIARLSIKRVDHTETVEDKIMQFSPYGSPIPLVFVG